MKHIFASALLLLFAVGCAHTSTLDWEKPYPGQRSSTGNPVVYNLKAVNRGMFLFNCIPLWSGDAGSPNQHEYDLLMDTVTRPKVRKMMELHLKKMGADKVEDLKFSTSSAGAFSLWIIWRRTAIAEGVAVKVLSESEKTAVIH